MVTVSRAGATRSRRIRFVIIFAACTLAWAAPARASLPGGYDPTPADNASGTTSDHFGANFVDAGDVSDPKDGKDDLLVGVPDAPDPGGLPGISGKVVFIDGSTGGQLATVRTPSGDSAVSHVGQPTAFGAAVATLGDIGSCPSGCSAIGPPDGYPEHVVSAPGSDISSAAVDMGIVYVLDGKTHQVMKKIRLAADDRPPSGTPGFGRGLAVPAGQPACIGFGGIGACPYAGGSAVAIGDLDGGGKPDIVVGSPDYSETQETDFAGCGAPDPGVCPSLGRVYAYRGEQISGSAATALEEPFLTLRWFDRATASQQPRLGAALAPVGDVGFCQIGPGFGGQSSSCLTATTDSLPVSSPDGVADFAVSAPGLDAGTGGDAGTAFAVDGKSALLIGQLNPPEPQANAGFAAFPRTAAGDLAGSPLPDFYLSAPGQDLAGNADEGRAYALSGEVTAPSLLGAFDDPLPTAGAKFGTGLAGLGDVVGDAPGEIAAGRGDGGGSVQIVSPCKQRILQTVDSPEAGIGFGSAIASVNLNLDDFLDLAIGAPGYAGGKGRIYLMKSNGAPGPSFEGCNPSTGGGGGGGGGGTSGGGSTGGGTSGGSGSTRPRSRVKRLTKRTIQLNGTKKKVGIGKLVTLKGRLTARARKSTCQARVKVAIERYELAGFYLTIDVAVTKRDGTFATSTRPSRTTIYRARVTQTKRCMPVTSKKVKISAKAV